MFETIYGNEKVKQKLFTALRKKTIGNSLLFQGPDGCGKRVFAELLAKFLVTGDSLYPHAHPDIRIFRPEGKLSLHSIESMRTFCESVYMAPFEAKKKVFIISQAERMLPYSANALLKTLEEPAVDTYIIMLTDQPERVLPTVRSRLWKISFCSLCVHEIARFLQEQKGIEVSTARSWACLAAGSLTRALEFLSNDEDIIRSELFGVLRQMSFPSFGELKEFCEVLGKELSLQKNRIQEQLQEEYISQASNGEELSAASLAQIQKQIEGAASLQQNHVFDYLFEQILFWWRDLTLLKAGADRALCYHKAHLDRLEEAAAKKFTPITKVENYILEAKLCLERGIPASSVLETLFLRLMKV